MKRPRPTRPAPHEHRLRDLSDFGANPGALRARSYVPDGLRRGAPLVVVLHGCTQNAAGYDLGTGWSTLADAHGFALLFPEQRQANNANRCFNWFEPGDMARGEGEPASIAAMVARMIADHGYDPRRVFVTGLSAGGAMTAVMLATYPELFAGGAVIAGLPYDCARGVRHALEAMRSVAAVAPEVRAKQVRAASQHGGQWPSLSVWHGDADQTVAPANADALVEQWLGVHGIAALTREDDRVDGQAHSVWRDAAGKVRVEQYNIAGLGHGVPIAADGAPGGGVPAPFIIAANIASTRHIAAFWGIAPARVSERPSQPREPVRKPMSRPVRKLEPASLATPAPERARGVSAVIEVALRNAGLMK